MVDDDDVPHVSKIDQSLTDGDIPPSTSSSEMVCTHVVYICIKCDCCIMLA